MDCSGCGYLMEIHRSLVRIRLEGLFFFFSFFHTHNQQTPPSLSSLQSGQRGMYTTSSGLTIAYMSGAKPDTGSSSSSSSQTPSQATSTDSKNLVRFCSYYNDFFFTGSHSYCQGYWHSRGIGRCLGLGGLISTHENFPN